MTTNIILLTIDALRADHVSGYGYERQTTPFLDELASRAFVFEEAISASSHTREALPAILTGCYPSDAIASDYTLNADSIATHLSDTHTSAAFHSNPYVSRAYNFDRDFDKFDDDMYLSRSRILALFQRALDKFVLNRGEYHARAEEINKRSLEWLTSIGKEPFFLWNHYMDVHGPYNPPKGYTLGKSEMSSEEAQSLYQKTINAPEEVTESERNQLVDTYDGEIRYLDRQIKSLVNTLKERSLFEESLVIVTADHGDAFDEHGYYTHPRQLHDPLLRVPLIVSAPGSKRGKRIATPVSTLDIVPTILFSLDRMSEHLPGEALMLIAEGEDSVGDNTVFASATGEDENEGIRRFAARNRHWKAILERDLASGEVLNERLFDLEDDPEESKPIKPDNADPRKIVTELRDFSQQRLDPYSEDKDSEESPSNEVNERLKALGYK